MADGPYRRNDADDPPRRFQVAVLVVDDDDLICRAFARLGRDRWTIITEQSAESALTLLESSFELDVIFCDLFMPGMTGAQLFERCAETCPARRARFVFYSAGIDHPTMEAWLLKTGQPLLLKPVSNGVIEQTVERFARMSLPRGPRQEEEVVPPKIPYRDREQSHPELPALYDEEVEVTTGIINVAQTLDIPKDAMQELRIRYMHRTIQEWKPIIEDIESIKKTLAFAKKWLPVIAALLGGIFEAVSWLLRHIVFK